MPKLVDLTGKTFGEWSVIERDFNKSKTHTYWSCKCSCGTVKSINGDSLRYGSSTKCSKHPKSDKIRDITGQKFNDWTVLEFACRKNKNTYWKCRCKCGFEKIVVLEDLRDNRSKQCKQCRERQRIPKYVGRSFGKWLVIGYAGTDKWGERKWKCECQCEHKTIKIIRGSALRNNNSTKCRRCGEKSKYYKDVSGAFWRTVIRNARDRDLEFSITREYAWDMFIKQGKRCVFTGMDLNFPLVVGSYSNASLDRIDSSKGYIEGNIQWVTKEVNRMKGALSDEEFIVLCKKIAEHRK